LLKQLNLLVADVPNIVMSRFYGTRQLFIRNLYNKNNDLPSSVPHWHCGTPTGPFRPKGNPNVHCGETH